METSTSTIQNFSSEQNFTTFEDPNYDLMGPKYHRQVRIYIIIIMICVSLFGNLMAAEKIYQRWSHRSRTTALFFHLVLADLMVTFFTMTSQVIWEVMDKIWYAGNAFCKINKVMQTLALCSSNFILVIIAIDRFMAIVYPLQKWVGVHKLATIAWVFSLIPSLPNLYTFHVIYENSNPFCTSKFYTGELSIKFRQVYMLVVFSLVNIIPCILLVGLHAAILFTMAHHDKLYSLRRHAGNVYQGQHSTLYGEGNLKSTSLEDQDIELGERSGRTSTFMYCQHSNLNDCNQTSTNGASLLPKAKIKTLNLSIAVVVAFLVTNLPYLVYELCIAFKPNLKLGPQAVAIMGIISASNSSINPFIFLLFHSRSRLAQKLTSSCCPCTRICGDRIVDHSPRLRIVFKNSTSSNSSFPHHREMRLNHECS